MLYYFNLNIDCKNAMHLFSSDNNFIQLREAIINMFKNNNKEK